MARTDIASSNETTHNSIRYQYETDNFAAGISVDELEEAYAEKPGEGPNNFGVAIPGFLQERRIQRLPARGYNSDNEEGAIRAILYADIGPGTLGLAGIWASGANYTTTKSPNGRSLQSTR